LLVRPVDPSTYFSHDPMTLRRYLQLDVFADRPGAGNPLAVVLDAGACPEHGEVWSGGHVCNVVRGTIDWPV